MTTPTCPHDSDGPFINTDRELWRETKDHYYSPSIHVTEHGGIGINVGGTVHVMGVRTWHALADRIRQLEAERDQWKAAHDEMVVRNKLLRNRPDLPLERVTGYDEVMQQLAAERAKVERLLTDLQAIRNTNGCYCGDKCRRIINEFQLDRRATITT